MMISIQHVVLMLVFTCVFPFSTSAYVTSQQILQTDTGIQQYQSTGNLSGYVTDTQMTPLEGALIRVSFHGTYEENYSNPDGYYHVTNIPLCYCLKNATCSKEGYQTTIVWLSISENTTHDFILIPFGWYPYPLFNGTMGNNGWYRSCVNVTFVNLDSVDALFYQLDGGVFIEYSEPFEMCQNGNHVLSWYWVDEGNQSEEFSTMLKIDRTLPILQLSTQRISSSAIKIIANTTDEISGIHQVEFIVDGVSSDVVSTPPYEGYISGIGIHWVKAISSDNAGNSVNSTIITPYDLCNVLSQQKPLFSCFNSLLFFCN
jgi:hypothetical protein